MRLLVNPRPMLPIEEVLDAGTWDLKNWEREFLFRTSDGAHVRCRQALAEMTPYFIRVDAITKFKWSAGYLTREIGPAMIYKLLLSHPQLQDDYMPPRPKPPIIRGKPPAKGQPAPKVKPADKGQPAPKVKPVEKPPPPDKPTPAMIVARRMRICDFLAQAGWYDLAEKELARLLKDFPDQKKRATEALSLVGRLRARDEWELVKNWYHAGRHDGVRKRLASFNTTHASDEIKSDIRAMKARLDHEDEMMADAARALDECTKEAKTPRERSLASAAVVIRSELQPATAGRLDAFVSQVREAKRQQARSGKSSLTTEGLLSLAITGWLLGSPSAEARPESALSLWKTRQMMLEYLQESDAASRKKVLTAYLDTITPRVDIDEIAQLIDFLPPVEPARLLGPATTEVKLGRGPGAMTYHLKLPPEYTHARQYPVLVVLANAGEPATKMLDRWAEAAADHGYILVAPEWQKGVANRYGYSESEHDTVLDTLRDLRRRFQIDSDRVFLFGLGEGGKMAFDVGLAHPDLFAGVVPMGAGPNFYPRRYWRNAQYLPLYVVNGTRAGTSNELLREQFTNWVQRAKFGYPALWVEYKGRGIEWLPGEVPNIFDWMRNQRRMFPLRELGTDGNGTSFGNEFCTMRPEDNRFYWLSTSEIQPRNQVMPRNWNNLIQPAAMTGRIDASTGEITLRTQGLKQVSVWLGRNPKGQYMIDFEKPVTVRVGLTMYWVNKKVTPSLAVLLEDLYRRGDRKHLYLARIDLNLR
jgi:pimeloyl-ACP methyl ester carboxylesterase